MDDIFGSKKGGSNLNWMATYAELCDMFIDNQPHLKDLDFWF